MAPPPLPAKPRLPGPIVASPLVFATNVSRQQRFMLAILPVILTFAVAEVFMLTKFTSYVAILGITGLLFAPVLAWVLPTQLLASSQVKGEARPAPAWQAFGNPVVAILAGLVSAAFLFVESLLWLNDPVSRSLAFLFGLGVLALTFSLLPKLLKKRMVVELRDDRRRGARDFFNITSGGKTVLANIRLQYPEGDQEYDGFFQEIQEIGRLKNAYFILPPSACKELKITAYAVTLDEQLEGLPAIVEIHNKAGSYRFDLGLMGGTVTLPYGGESCAVEIKLPSFA